MWKFSLHSVKAKSITAKIHAIILQPRRKYYFSGWLVLSLIFLSTHHHRDMEASMGTCAFHCPYPDERGFPVWYAVKVIWIAVMFLYNMHCQAKTRKHFPPRKLISALLFIITTTNILHLCDHNSLSGSKTQLLFLLVWNESRISWWLQESFRVLLKYCIEEH